MQRDASAKALVDKNVMTFLIAITTLVRDLYGDRQQVCLNASQSKSRKSKRPARSSRPLLPILRRLRPSRDRPHRGHERERRCEPDGAERHDEPERAEYGGGGQHGCTTAATSSTIWLMTGKKSKLSIPSSRSE
jgi:hypothetical protein